MDMSTVPMFDDKIYLLSYNEPEYMKYTSFLLNEFMYSLLSLKDMTLEIDEIVKIGKKQKIKELDEEFNESYSILTSGRQIVINDILPNELWKSIFLASCSIFEATLVDICKYINSNEICVKKKEEQKTSKVLFIINKLRAYRKKEFDKICRLENFRIHDNDTYTKEEEFSILLNEVVNIYKIRNCIAHNNGKLKLCGPDNTIIIENLKNSISGLNIINKTPTQKESSLKNFLNNRIGNKDNNPEYIKDTYKIITVNKEFVLTYIEKCCQLLESIFIVRREIH